MVHIELTQAMEARLASIAAHDGTTIDRVSALALEHFILDREDSIEADEIMATNEPLVPWAEAKRTLGLER